MGFSWLKSTCSFQVTGDAQCNDSKHIETSDEKHVYIKIQL